MAYFRRLLGESEIPMPYRHPLIVSWLKVFGCNVSGTGKISAGLGCPSGCDFCCTLQLVAAPHQRHRFLVSPSVRRMQPVGGVDARAADLRSPRNRLHLVRPASQRTVAPRQRERGIDLREADPVLIHLAAEQHGVFIQGSCSGLLTSRISSTAARVCRERQESAELSRLVSASSTRGTIGGVAGIRGPFAGSWRLCWR